MTMRRAASALGWCLLVLALLRGIVSPVEECPGLGSHGWVAAATPPIPSPADLLPSRIKVWPWQSPCPGDAGRILAGPTILHTTTLVILGVGLIAWPSARTLAAVLGTSLIASGVLRAMVFPAQYCQAGLVRYVKVWPWQEVRLPRVCASAMSSDIALTLFHSAILASLGAALLLWRKSHVGRSTKDTGDEKIPRSPRAMTGEEVRTVAEAQEDSHDPLRIGGRVVTAEEVRLANVALGGLFEKWLRLAEQVGKPFEPDVLRDVVALGKDIEQRGLTEQMIAYTKQVEAEWEEDPSEAHAWLMERLYGRRE